MKTIQEALRHALAGLDPRERRTHGETLISAISELERARDTLAFATLAASRVLALANPLRERGHYSRDVETAFVALQRAIPDATKLPVAAEHPESWLDCSDCRALSKSGTKPYRCEVWMRLHPSTAEPRQVDPFGMPGKEGA